MSDLSLLSGEERKSNLGAVRSVDGPGTDMAGFLLRLEPNASARQAQLLSERVGGAAAILPDLVSRASVASCRNHCILGRAG